MRAKCRPNFAYVCRTYPTTHISRPFDWRFAICLRAIFEQLSKKHICKPDMASSHHFIIHCHAGLSTPWHARCSSGRTVAERDRERGRETVAEPASVIVTWHGSHKQIFNTAHYTQNGSVIRSLVTYKLVPSSTILVTLMMELLHSSETPVLTRTKRRNISNRRHSSYSPPWKPQILHNHIFISEFKMIPWNPSIPMHNSQQCVLIQQIESQV
jgi:hypothetical protein